MSPQDLEQFNANLIGGDNLSGSHHLDQNFFFRPVAGYSKIQDADQGSVFVRRLDLARCRDGGRIRLYAGQSVGEVSQRTKGHSDVAGHVPGAAVWPPSPVVVVVSHRYVLWRRVGPSQLGLA